MELEYYIKKYREERINKNNRILGDKNKELKLEFYSKLNKLIDEQVIHQNNGDQNKIKHISLCRLISSCYTGSYESYLWLSNSQLYYDNYKSYVYWKPAFIYDSIDNDMMEIEKLLRVRFVHIEAYELFALKRKLILDDWITFEKYFCNLVKASKGEIINSSLKVEDEILILYGDYMERLQIIGRIGITKGEGYE